MNIRKADDSDRPLIQEMIDSDPWHAGKGSPDFFFEPFSEAMVIEDKEGPVMVVRISRALRINSVFGTDALRNKETMKTLAAWLKTMAEGSGFREMLYTSENPGLRKFGTTIGFAETPDVVMTLEPKGDK